jgi:hypothetical protein
VLCVTSNRSGGESAGHSLLPLSSATCVQHLQLVELRGGEYQAHAHSPLRINHRRFGLEGLIVTRDSQRYGGLGRKRADGIDKAALLGEIRGPARNLCIPLSVDGFGSGGKRKTENGEKRAPLL